MGYTNGKKVDEGIKMKKIAVALTVVALASPAFAGGHGHGHGHGGYGYHQTSAYPLILGGVIGYIVGKNDQPQPVYQPAPIVIYQGQQAPAPQQVCETKIMNDQFGQAREFTACYYR